MLDGDTLVFVEVRFRRNARFGGGVASVDARKRRKLVTAARAFLHMHRGLADATCRFDVIDASGDPAAPTFDWLRDACRADDGNRIRRRWPGPYKDVRGHRSGEHP